MTTGSCSCRHIHYTTTRPPTLLVNCHCAECRKQSGAPYQTWAHFHPSQIHWQTEPPTTRASSAIAKRSFCPRCGSTLSMVYNDVPDVIGIAAGTIDSWGESGSGSGNESGKGEVPGPRAHIFLREKAEWFVVPEDGLERFEGHMPGY